MHATVDQTAANRTATRTTATRTPGGRRAAGRPNLVVGWAAGLVQVWPDEDGGIAARRPSAPLGTPEAVYELLAAVDGQDLASYAERHAADAAAVLALTHHLEDEVLGASIEVRGELSPSTVLALIRRTGRRHRIAS